MWASLLLLILLPTTLFMKLGTSAPIHSDGLGRENNAQSAKKPKIETVPRCKLLISEMLPGFKASNTAILPFIELKQTCIKRRGPIPKNVLSPYKLLILRGNPLLLVAVVDFSNFAFDERKEFIVIGSPRVTNVDISMSSPHVQSIFSRTIAEAMLPSPIEGSYAVVLIRDDRKGYSDLNLFITPEGIQVPRLLSNAQKSLISEKAVDMLILSKQDDMYGYEFSFLWQPNQPGRAAIFSETWKELSQADSETSMSMCTTDYDGFNADSFILTTATPGSRNLCPFIPPNDSMEQSVDNSETKTERPVIHFTDEAYVNAHKAFKFDPQWVPRCQKYFPQREEVLEKPSLRDWITFSDDIASCKFWCFACSKYLQLGFRTDIKNKPHIIQKGYFSEDVYENSAKIKAHEQYPLHHESMEFHKMIRETDSMDAVNTVIRRFEDHEMGRFNSTMNTVLFAYASAKAGISFHAYELMMKALRLMGANVGWLQHTDDASQSIAKVISTTLHLKLLKQLVSNNVPFSLMVDSSTSFNQPYLAVYIQTLENNVPVTRFYSLIYLAQGERGKMMAEALRKQVELDSESVPSFREYFSSKLVAIVSDGAANMVGIHESFKVHVSAYVGRTVANIECLAHKLDNSFKLGVKQDEEVFKGLNLASSVDQTKIEQIKYFENFEKSTNAFYKFFSGHGHKKWIHLLSTAEDIGVVPKRMKYVFPIRWSDSHFKALETIHHNYYALVEDLSQVQVDKNFDSCSRATALELYEQLTDKTFMVVLHEFLDVLTVFKIASKRFQQASAIIIGKVEFVYDVIYQLEQFKTVPGSWLKDFLKSCACAGKCDGGTCTLDMYDQCQNVILNNVILKNNFKTVLYYSFVRNYLFNNMIASVKKYFKLDLLESFELFNPARLVFTSGEMHDHDYLSLEQFYTENAASIIDVDQISNTMKVQQICSFYNINDDTCKTFEQEWTAVLRCVVTLNGMDASVDPAKFWSIALGKCDASWTPLTREVVGYALVTPFSSSECERGFSLMNNIKTKSRSGLDKDTLDALVRVKANGPDVENLNAYEHTVEFLKLYARVDDRECNDGNKKSDQTCSAR